MHNYDIQHLKCFAAAVRLKSISKAAKAMFMSQQALSKRLRTLEKTLGFTLLSRETTGVSLTVEGFDFYQRAIEAIEAFDACVAHGEQIARRSPLSASLCALPLCFESFGGALSAKAMEHFQNSHMPLQFVFAELPDTLVATSVLNRTYDFGIGSYPEGDSRLQSRTLAEFSFSVLVGKNHPLSNASHLAPIQLTAFEMIVPSMESGPSGLPNFANINLDDQKISPLRITSISEEKLLEDNRAFIVKPTQNALRYLSTKNVRTIPLVDERNSPITASLDLFWRSDLSMTEAHRALKAFVERSYRGRGLKDKEAPRNH
ncbi:LysR family transcriptional regulator [Adlercreutzia caecimuris]|uniref:LysR family transcriptional regulator n=1 Tax=Adlercreutzia caecimuris TaxID=671266 RepID=UPI0025709B6C|nr:LysR family transcriptional regulator [Adlercreutzia caecimuris]